MFRQKLVIDYFSQNNPFFLQAKIEFLIKKQVTTVTFKYYRHHPSEVYFIKINK